MKKWLLLIVSVLLGSGAYAQDPVDYDTDIAPILQNSCNSCHSSGQFGFNSTSYAEVMASVSPPDRYDKNHVIPGDPDGSRSVTL